MFTNRVTRYSPPKQVFEDGCIHYFFYWQHQSLTNSFWKEGFLVVPSVWGGVAEVVGVR